MEKVVAVEVEDAVEEVGVVVEEVVEVVPAAWWWWRWRWRGLGERVGEVVEVPVCLLCLPSANSSSRVLRRCSSGAVFRHCCPYNLPVSMGDLHLPCGFIS